MKKIAMIRNGIVENIAVWDGVSEWHPGSQFELIDVTEATYPIGCGYIYDPTKEPSFFPEPEVISE